MTDAKVTGLAGFEERFLETRGSRLRYLVAGEGDPLVLVHGLGGSAANWLALAPLMRIWREFGRVQSQRGTRTRTV